MLPTIPPPDSDPALFTAAFSAAGRATAAVVFVLAGTGFTVSSFLESTRFPDRGEVQAAEPCLECVPRTLEAFAGPCTDGSSDLLENGLGVAPAAAKNGKSVVRCLDPV